MTFAICCLLVVARVLYIVICFVFCFCLVCIGCVLCLCGCGPLVVCPWLLCVACWLMFVVRWLWFVVGCVVCVVCLVVLVGGCFVVVVVFRLRVLQCVVCFVRGFVFNVCVFVCAFGVVRVVSCAVHGRILFVV